MKNLEYYVGRKVKGVKFETREYRDVNFPSTMKEFIGKEGEIIEYDRDYKSFLIKFENPKKKTWSYPEEVILPQLEGELIGYLINDEKYAKIIAGLVGISVNTLLTLTDDKVHFRVGTSTEEIVKKFDLLDKCTPVYKSGEVEAPEINGYEMRDESESSLYYGCAELLKAWFDSSINRRIVSMTLDSGVVINKEQINQVQEYLLSKKK